jgi:hypothetical protein
MKKPSKPRPAANTTPMRPVADQRLREIEGGVSVDGVKDHSI